MPIAKPTRPYQLFNEDCFAVFERLAPNSVDLVLADLPYGITSNKWDETLPVGEMWACLTNIVKDVSACVFTSCQPFSSLLVASNVSQFRHEWIWIKNRGSNFANTVREPFKEHESVLVFSKGRWTYNKQMQERTGAGLERVQSNLNFRSKSKNYRDFEGREAVKLPDLRVPSSWQKFNTACGSEKTNHPTQKPVALMEYLIRTYTNDGDTVLDFCMGSGTTGVACMNLNRKFIGCENDVEHGYFETSKRRIEEAYLRNSAKLVNGA